jgi:hypothetical protein
MEVVVSRTYFVDSGEQKRILSYTTCHSTVAEKKKIFISDHRLSNAYFE